MLKARVEYMDGRPYLVFDVGATTLNALKTSWVLVNEKKSRFANSKAVF